MTSEKYRKFLNDIFKATIHVFSKPLLYIFTAYWLLFLAFIMVINDKQYCCRSTSDWFYENFSMDDKLRESFKRFYVKLEAEQESLEADFQKVIDKKLWDLYES